MRSRRKLQRADSQTVDTAAPDAKTIKTAGCKLALRQKFKAAELCCRLAALRLGFGLCLFVSVRGKFLGYVFLELFSIHAIAFGGVYENVFAAGGGSLIRRIQQADFEKQLAKSGLVVVPTCLTRSSCADVESFFTLPCADSPEPELGCRRDGQSGNGDRQQVSLP